MILPKIKRICASFMAITMLLVFIALFAVCCGGCSSTTDLRDIPLRSGSVPYQLPAGEYIDVYGKPHVEEYTRWSMADEDVYEYVRSMPSKR